MSGGEEIVRVGIMAAALLAVFAGAGLYLRGFWVYLRAVLWLRKPDQSDLRRRYKSSALALLWREPTMAPAKWQLAMAAVGVLVFVAGGAVFNWLK